jgi:hypothetical protein
VVSVGHRQRVFDGDGSSRAADLSNREREVLRHGRRQDGMYRAPQERLGRRVQGGATSTAIVENRAVRTDEEQEIRQDVEARVESDGWVSHESSIGVRRGAASLSLNG